MTEYQALAIERRDSDVFDFFVDAIVKENPGLPRQSAAEMVNARASRPSPRYPALQLEGVPAPLGTRYSGFPADPVLGP